MSEQSNDISTERQRAPLQTLSTCESKFWQWFGPSLAEDWMRGVVGEFWVANALGFLNEPREGWKPWDLETKTGVKVEVKTSGCLRRKNDEIVPIKNIKFDIENVNVDEETEKGLSARQYRPADVYVFCLHSSLNPKTLNPMVISQWEFHVIATAVLDAKRPKAKSITLNPLKKLGTAKTDFAGLKEAILSAANCDL